MPLTLSCATRGLAGCAVLAVTVLLFEPTVRLPSLVAAGFSRPVVRLEADDTQSARAQDGRSGGYDAAWYQDMAWRNIGPFRGGRAVAVAGVSSDPLTYYFGGVGSGVWKTTDAGETWANISGSAFKTSSVGAIAVAESDPNVIFVGMGEHPVRGVMTSHGDGVYRSTDAGRTWTHVGLARTRQISRVQIHPKNPDMVYVAAQGAPYGPTKDRGVYRSTDGGRNWEQVLSIGETAGASELSLDPANPRVLYAAFWDHLRQPWEVRSGGPGSGIHKSSDGGTTWQKLTKGLPESMGKIGVAVSSSSDRVYAIVEADPNGGLYRSDDGGQNWSLMNSEWVIRTRAWYYTKVIADPQNPDVVWVMNASVSRSIDGGRTFTRVFVPHGDNHALWINPRNTLALINANDGGANVSLNGGKTWSTQNNQPTAQFYRVNADNRFPYYVYGGQQDNTSVAIASRAPGGITERDWHQVGGCESAHVAFDPDDPAYIYAGCYMGQISEYDAATGSMRDVMAYPTLPAAVPPRDMKYRFNWNAPILVSRHDPRVIYHAGNVLLRSDDRGRTWKELGGDLTRNDKSKQGPGGRPITNEGAGGEIYNTIYYVAESPHDRDTLWTGSDDGLVHVTRDGGKTWANVTRPAAGEAMINSIEVSPHDPATAYVAVTRYKFNDFTPHLFKTIDYGKKWDRLVDGLAEDSWVRVVREDPVRPGLLYAGTETGMYVSFNGGRRWQSLQLNLPVTPITDLKVHKNDLLASTAGRAFWILDDLSPLQQLDAKLSAGELHLFKPRAAYRTRGFGSPFGGTNPRAGANPPEGAIIDYYVAKVPEAGVTVEILNESGTVVRRYASKRKEGDEQAPRPISIKAGMNRLAWDLRHDAVAAVPGLFVFGTLRGRLAVPGTYQVRVTAGDLSRTESVQVLPDPRVDTPASEFTAQDEFLARVEADLADLHTAVIRIRGVRSQLEEMIKRVADLPAREAVQKSGKALVERLDEMEDTLIQKRTVDGQTVINFPTRLNQNYIYLRSAADSPYGGLTQGARQRFADLSTEWARHKATLGRMFGEELAAFNALMREQGVPAVIVPAIKP